MRNIIAVIVGALLVSVVTSNCTPRKLRNLDLKACPDEVRSQYIWTSDEINEDSCQNYSVYFLMDVSKTVIRSGADTSSKNMITLQSQYMNEIMDLLTLDFFQWTYHDIIPYASDALSYNHDFYYNFWNFFPIGELMEEMSSSRESRHVVTHEAETILQLIEAQPDLFEFYMGKNKGWSIINSGLKVVRDQSLGTIGQQKRLIVIMTDGRPEAPRRRRREIREMYETADELREEGNTHIHCLVMKFTRQAKRFWKNDELCDSKQVITSTTEVDSDMVAQALPFLADRRVFCQEHFLEVLTPTTDQPIAAPTDQPTTYPTPEPTYLPTKKPIESPTKEPTKIPSYEPTNLPTSNPTKKPTKNPTSKPTDAPSAQPTETPTSHPTDEPTVNPSKTPTINPTPLPTKAPFVACDAFQEVSELEVVHLNFEEVEIGVNNLGGFCGLTGVTGVNCGPGFPQIIEYKNITIFNNTEVNLIVSNTSTYLASQGNLQGNQFNIGTTGQFGQLSLKKTNSVSLNFAFEDNSGLPLTFPVFDFTIFDIDQEICSCNDCACENCAFREVIEFDVQGLTTKASDFQFFTDSSTSLCKEEEGTKVAFKSTQFGDASDNPSDISSLSQFAREVSLKIRFLEVSGFEFTYQIQGGNPTQGRSLNFAGSSSLSPCSTQNDANNNEPDDVDHGFPNIIF